MADYWASNPFNYYGGRSGQAFYEASQKIADLCDQTRKDLARLIGASESEIVFTRNTTHGINIVANGFPLKPRDQVIISDIENQSNHIPWLSLSSRLGIEVKVVESDNLGQIDPAEIERAITRRTRLISVTCVSNIFGTVQPVEEIGELAKSRGIMVLLDAAQLMGRLPVDVGRLGCDFLVSCGRKGLMGPQGMGFLYGKLSSLEMLKPLELGGGSASLTGLHDYSLSDVPHRFESGIQNAPGMIGLGRAVNYVGTDIGVESIPHMVEPLTRKLIEGLEEIHSVTVYGPKDPKLQVGIVSFNVGELDSGKVAAKLDQKGRVIVAAGSHGAPHVMKKIGARGTVRASPHCYNNDEDIAALLRHIKDVAVEK